MYTIVTAACAIIVLMLPVLLLLDSAIDRADRFIGRGKVVRFLFAVSAACWKWFLSRFRKYNFASRFTIVDGEFHDRGSPKMPNEK